MEEETSTIMAALATLSPRKLSNLTNSILSLTNIHHRRLTFLLSSSTLFSLTLHRLLSLSLTKKTQLIARHLTSLLNLITSHLHPPPPPSPRSSMSVNFRDLDATLLLLFLCETHHHHSDKLETPISKWRVVLKNLYSDTMLTSQSLTGACRSGILITHIEMVIRCWRFIGVMGGDGSQEQRETAASSAAVVALPSVEVKGGGGAVECVICKEEMREGRDVCEMPCQHLFHWVCLLRWLRRRNTCPCCRFALPTDHVFGEIQRLWKFLMKSGGRNEDCG